MILINSSPKDALKIFQPFLPIFVPIGVGYLLGMAEREGIEPLYVDEQVEDNVLGRIDELVRRLRKPYVFGFSVLTAAFGQALKVSEGLKRRYPDCFICFGGIHPTAAPEEVLAYPHIDAVLRGEGEYAFIELYRSLKAGRDYTHIAGLSYRNGGGVVHNERGPVIEDLDSIPPFPYHLFDSGQYDLGFVGSSRGCPHACIFCSNRITTGKKYRTRSAESVVAEIEMLRDRYGLRNILFLDDNLLVNKARIYSLIAKFKEKGFDKTMGFSFQARGDNVNPQLLKDLYDVGFRSVFFGLETASEKLMKRVRKGETVAQCIEAVKMSKAVGFHVSATFVYALPGETHQDRMDCVGLAKDLRIDLVRFNNATPYPGTELYEIAKTEGRLHIVGQYENFNSVSTFIENPFKHIPLSYVPENNSEADIRRDILYSYFSYYIDYEKVKSIFTRPQLSVGWFDAGEKLRDLIRKIPALVLLAFMMLIKFGQLFYLSAIKKETRISLGFFFSTFEGLWKRRK